MVAVATNSATLLDLSLQSFATGKADVLTEGTVEYSLQKMRKYRFL